MSGLILDVCAPGTGQEPNLWLSLLVGMVGVVLFVDAIRRRRH